MVQENYPIERAVKIFLRPLALPAPLNAVIQPMARLTQGLLFQGLLTGPDPYFFSPARCSTDTVYAWVR